MKGQSLSRKRKERSQKAILPFNVCKGLKKNVTNDEVKDRA